MHSSIRQHLPWRIQKILTREFYVKQLTDLVFRGVQHTPAMAADLESSLDVLSLLDHGNVNNYLVAIKSLLLHLPVGVTVTVLSDGTLLPSDINILKSHIAGVRVLIRDDIAVPASYAATIHRWCSEYRYLAKLMYLPFATDKPLLMILDSDIVFRRQLPASMVRLPLGVAATFNCDHDHSRYDPCFHYLQEYADSRGISLIKNLNCGLMLWDRAQLRPLDAVEFLEYVVQRHGLLHAVAEQDAWALLASQVRATALPTDFLVLCNWDCNDSEHRQKATAIHYVRGERYRRFDYMRDGWRTMRLLRRNGTEGGPPSPVSSWTRTSDDCGC